VKKIPRQRIPWLSLLLLLAAYSIFSWFLIRTLGAVALVLVSGVAVIQALLLTTWLNGLKRFFSLWLRSDIGYFTLILMLSLGSTMALVWFKTFGYCLILVSSELLARLDLQNAGHNRWQTLLILMIVSWLGLGVGWTAAQNPLFRLVS
jgi:hypothetical protein